MPLDVIIEADPAFRFQNSWREFERGPSTDIWSRLASHLTHMAAAGKNHRIEVFLCARDDLLILDPDLDFVARVIDEALNSVWGAEVFLVADRQLENIGPAELKRLLDLLIGRGIADIFEVGREEGIDLRENKSLEIDPEFLLELIGGTKNKRRVDREDLTADGWGCLLPPRESSRSPYLNYFGRTEFAPDENSRLLVYCSGEPNYAKAFVKRCRGIYDTRVAGVADINRCLDKSFREELVVEGLSVLDFKGQVDLCYMLLRLNQRRTVVHDATLSKRVKLTMGKRLPPFELGPHPRILISNGFPPNEDQCVEAAKEAGVIKSLCRLDGEIEICPGLDFGSLPDLIENSQPLAFMFQGHGEQNVGLLDVSKQGCNPDRLVEYFAGCKKGIGLVYFASCYSSEAARRLAEIGVGIAIGFDSLVKTESTLIMAKEIFPVVLGARDGDSFVNSVLAAVENAAGRIAARYSNSVIPVAYFSSR